MPPEDDRPPEDNPILVDFHVDAAADTLEQVSLVVLSADPSAIEPFGASQLRGASTALITCKQSPF
jgi:hypothetical protein